MGVLHVQMVSIIVARFPDDSVVSCTVWNAEFLSICVFDDVQSSVLGFPLVHSSCIATNNSSNQI